MTNYLDIKDPNFKIKIVNLLTDLWGEKFVKNIKSYYTDKSNDEIYTSVYKLLNLYYGEEATIKILNGSNAPKIDKDLIKSKLNLEKFFDVKMYLLGFLFLFSTSIFFGNFVPFFVFFVPLFTLYFVFESYQKFGERSLHGKSMLFMFIPLCLWYISDLLSLFFNRTNPFISFLFIVGQVLLLASFVYSIRIFNPHYSFLKDKKKLGVIQILSVIALFIFYNFFRFIWSLDISLYSKIFTQSFVLLDILIILTLFVMMYLVFFSKYNIYWIVLLIAMKLNLMVDVYHALFPNIFSPFMVLICLTKYLLFAFAVLLLQNITKQVVNDYVIEGKEVN